LKRRAFPRGDYSRKNDHYDIFVTKNENVSVRNGARARACARARTLRSQFTYD